MSYIEILQESKRESDDRLGYLESQYRAYLTHLIDEFIVKVPNELYFANKKIDLDNIKDLIDIYNSQGNTRTELEIEVENERFKIGIDLLYVNEHFICEITITKGNEIIGSKIKFNQRHDIFRGQKPLYKNVIDILEKINEYYINLYNYNQYDNFKNYKIEIESLFLIMESIQKDKFSELESKNSSSPQNFHYLIEKLEEGHFIKTASDDPSNFHLTFKGHEFLKMWATMWIRSEIENQYNCSINDLNMTVFMSLAVELYKSKKKTETK